MKRLIVLAVASTAALAGCMSMYDEPREKGDRARSRDLVPTYNSRTPQVTIVTNGEQDCTKKKAQIVVDQEPIYFFRDGTNRAFPIQWTIQTAGYTFVSNNNVADPTPVSPGVARGEINGCHAGASTMTCTNKNGNSGMWKYTLTVQDNACLKNKPLVLDPTIGND